MLSRSEKYLQIAYDPRKMDVIYLPSPDGRSFEKCSLIDPDERYSNQTIYDVEYLLANEELERKKRAGEQLQNEVDLMARIENVARRATQETEKYQDKTESNLQKTSGIREHRAEEKAQRREKEAFELQDKLKPSPPQKTKKSTKKSHQSNSPKSTETNYLELLKQRRKKNKHGK
ncbi:MAG: hypothetical protein AB4062_14390 [Crocosphaera sp.]